MKTLFTLILCVYCVSVFSQRSQQNSIDATYIFQKASLTIYNSESKAEVNKQVVVDPALLDTTSMFFEKVFLEATISNGVLSSCVLPNHQDYLVQDELMLTPAKESDKKADSDINRLQLMPYSTSFDDDILSFTFLYLYGSSQYNFPLEAKLVITMSKQKYP